MGKTTLEAAQIDSLMETINDLFTGIKVIVYKEVLKQPDQSVSTMNLTSC